jgi:hypothetical protein
MGSRLHRVDFYDPRTLEAVSQAFDAICNVLRKDDPFRDYAEDQRFWRQRGRL